MSRSPASRFGLRRAMTLLPIRTISNSPDAVITLGVGKNMVASIRFWLRAFGVTENDKKTKLGDYLFDESKGKDKYLEDIATLWLLHFNLVFSEDSTGFEDFK